MVERFGNAKTKNGKITPVYKVECYNCKTVRLIKRLSHALAHEKIKCKKCSNKSNHPQGEYKGIRISWFNKYKINSASRNLDFLITLEDCIDIYLKQNKKCALTNLDITTNGDFSKITASIDRIDNSKGILKIIYNLFIKILI